MSSTSQLITDFTLDSSEGVPVRASQFRGRRNLVMAFIGSLPGAIMEWLNSLAHHADDLEQEEARVLVVVHGTAEQARELREELGAPFIFLADCEADVHRRYGAMTSDGRSIPTLIIADRYGEIYSVHHATSGPALPNAADVIASLRHINILCDE